MTLARLARLAGRVAALTASGLQLGCALASVPGSDVASGGSSEAREVPLQLRSEQIIVALPRLPPTLLADTASSLARQYDLEVRGPGFPLASIDLHCIVFEVRPGVEVDALLAELARNPDVRLAQRNVRFEVQGTVSPPAVARPADPGTVSHSDPYAALQHGPEEIRADRAHRVATGRNVKVGIIDTGVDSDHPDLKARVIASRSFVQGGEGSFKRDAHGTAVAGVIAATADDGVGIYGVAPRAEVLAAKACWHPANGEGRALCSSWSLARAFDYAIQSGVRVLNVSLGGPPDALLEQLLERAAERSIVVVAAAGEEPGRLLFPASLESVIAVVDSGSLEAPRASAWNGSPGTLVAAPGDEILTTAPGEAYLFRSGSSLATAHVSGLVAMLLEVDPRLTPDRVRALLRTSASAGGSGTNVGRVDACALLEAVRATADC